jgi:uncharacterized membrane protein
MQQENTNISSNQSSTAVGIGVNVDANINATDTIDKADTSGEVGEAVTLRQRTSKLDKSEDSKEGEACGRKKKAKPMTLFLKSVKFFSFVFAVGLLSSLAFEYVTGASRLYVYLLIGLAVSLQASYYKLRVYYDPSYAPDCDCATQDEKFIPSKKDMMNGVFTVLGHKKSALLFNIPNTVFGVLFYSFLIYITYVQFYAYSLTLLATLTSCIGSVYLWYTMIIEVKSVCVLCSTIHATNFLTLVALLL